LSKNNRVTTKRRDTVQRNGPPEAVPRATLRQRIAGATAAVGRRLAAIPGANKALLACLVVLFLALALALAFLAPKPPGTERTLDGLASLVDDQRVA